MGELVCDGTSFSCPFCTTQLKLSVPSSSAKGSSKNLANTGNCFFPPPGGQCLVVPSAPVPCVPSTSVVDPGQKPVKIDGMQGLGAGCKFSCAKGGLLSVASPGQTVAKHDGATSDSFELTPATVAEIALTIVGPGKFIKGAQGAVKVLRAAARIAPAAIKAIPKLLKKSKPPAKAPSAGPAAAKKQRNKPPGPDPKAEGRPHSIIEKPGKDGQYTTHHGDGTYKQYRGSGKDHGNIPRPNVKENQLNQSPKGPIPGKPTVRPARPDEIPKG